MKTEPTCVSGPQDHPQVWPFTRRIPKAQLSPIHSSASLSQKDPPHTQQRGTVQGQRPGDSNCFQVSSPGGVPQKAFNPPVRNYNNMY